MHEYDELEKKWLKFKIKKTLLPITFITSLCVIALISILFFDFSPQNQSVEKSLEKQSQMIQQKQQKEVEKKIDAIEKNQKEVTKKPPVKVVKIPSYEPNVDFLEQNMENENSQVRLQPQEVVIDEEKINLSQSQPPQQQNSKVQNNQTQKQEETNTNNEELSVSKSEKKFDPKEYEKRFVQTNKIKYALFLANYYYDKNDYEKSYKWAYAINQIDPTNEDGWLFFAKSLYKLNKKDDAIKVLRSYLNHYDSTAANELLRKIIQGVI